jgi:hypothetical protein
MRIAGMLRWVVFSNFFYGISVIALQWQTAIILGLPFANPWFYLATFSATLLYYSHAYLFDTSTEAADERMQWYRRYARVIRVSQGILSLLLLIAILQLFCLLVLPLAGNRFSTAGSPLLWRYSARESFIQPAQIWVA